MQVVRSLKQSRAGRRRTWVSLAWASALVLAASSAQATSLGFEESEGVPFGTGTVQVLGTTWTGGSARTIGSPLLYADGVQAYFIDSLFGSGAGQVVFDTPVTEVAFVFSWSEDLGIPLGSGEYFDELNNSLGVFSAQVADGMDTVMTELASGTPIARISFVGGVVDAVSWTPVPEPSTAALLGLGLLAVTVGRRA